LQVHSHYCSLSCIASSQSLLQPVLYCKFTVTIAACPVLQVHSHYCSLSCIASSQSLLQPVLCCKLTVTIAACPVFARCRAVSRRLMSSQRRQLLFISPYFVFSSTSDYSPLTVTSALGKLVARCPVIDVFSIKWVFFSWLTWRAVKYRCSVQRSNVLTKKPTKETINQFHNLLTNFVFC
jgi:hypothetical protein